jgi:hypothetical protein
LKINRREIAKVALQKAVHLRSSLGLGIYDAVCPYDCAENLGLEVHFIDIPSLEGMYVKGNPPIVFISSLRPAGRATYTCAHEMGHHIFNHGTRVDEILDPLNAKQKTEEEQLVQTFAGFFLMPKSALERGLFLRGINIETVKPIDIFSLACWFGVGYRTLIDHAEFSLRILSTSHAEALRQVTPRQIKLSLLGKDDIGSLIYVDKHWTGRAIDAQVGDTILLPKGTVHSNNKLQQINSTNAYEIFQAMAAGRDRFLDPNTGWAAFIRVSKRDFTGRCIYRHLEEPEDD